jgi:methyl-accepting chemotaxis protein
MADTVNLNTAQTDELTNLPGVGQAMADRIAANRPYKEIEDLRQVTGVGPVFLERLKPLVSVSDVETPQDEEAIIYLDAETVSQSEADETPVELEVEDSIPEWDEPQPELDTTFEEILTKEKAIIPVKETDKSKKRPTKEPKPITWGQVLLVVAISSFTTFILAVLLSIGIIGSLNGGLRYASTQQISTLSQQVESMGLEISTLNQDIEGIRARLDNLESLSGRMGELETETEQLSQDMGAMNDLVEGMDEKVSEIADNAERFQLFLNGLGDLLETLVELPQEVP